LDGLVHLIFAQTINNVPFLYQFLGRGSSGQSMDFMFEIYKKFGTLEVEDQIEGAKFLSQLPYVDKTKLAIWGWSYGGFVTAMVMGKDVDSVLKCGISVAPVGYSVFCWVF
jgi:dipeptidyl-peptidase-4